MKKIFFLVLSILFLAVSCDIDNRTYKKVNIQADDSEFQIEYIQTDNSSLGVDLTVSNLSQKSVYLIFSNTDTVSSWSAPTVARLNQTEAEIHREEVVYHLLSQVKYDKDSGRRGDTSDLRDKVGDTVTFYADSGDGKGDKGTIEAYCAKTVEIGNKQLSIFVQKYDFYKRENVWEKTITLSMVNQLANKFMSTGEDNDIYDWVTNLYGEEWGEHQSTSYIEPNNNITILLFNIANEDINTSTLGYFYSKDNFTKEEIEYSNERIMFYINANYYSEKEDATWEITDSKPSKIVSTLGHEFQHMIAFYQKVVKNNLTSPIETWLNEFCSLATEDLLAYKLGINGPRGRKTPECNYSSEKDSRINVFNYYYNQYPLFSWGSSNSGYYYNPAFMFGAFLIRNYGGAEIFSNIVKDPDITPKVIQKYTGESLGTLVRKWGVACLMSDMTDEILAGNKIGYNFGSQWQTYWLNEISYNVGSINIFSYFYKPRIYSAVFNNTVSIGGQLSPSATNTFCCIGENVTGTIKKRITMNPNIKPTVVIRSKI